MFKSQSDGQAPAEQTVMAFNQMQSDRSTITFYWNCPMCQTKVFGVTQRGEDSSIRRCHICRNFTKVSIFANGIY